MTSIAAGDLTKLREQQQKSTLYLSPLNPDVLLAARVDDGAIARGDRSITYDTGTGTAAQFARIVAGQTLWVGETAGTYNVGKVRVKSIAGDETSGTITIAENGIDWVDDLFLTIIEFYDIWPIPPRIDAAGVGYKDYTITYTDQNEEPPPVAIMGPHRAGFLAGGSLVFTLDGSDSYAIADGAAVTGYAWTATGGVIANAAIATTTITFIATGYYWVTLTVTDDNGKTQLTRRCYFVYDATTTPYRDFTISSCGGDWNSGGWQFSAELFGDVSLAIPSLSDWQDGTLVLLWHQNYIDGVADNVNIWDIGDEVICAGYLQRDVDTDDLASSGTGSVSITVVSPTLYMSQKNIMGSVAIEANSSPDAWNEYETWLSAGRAIHHLLRWHSTVIETCDVLGLTDNTLQAYQVAFTEDSLLDMVNQFGYERGIFAKLVSAKDGRLYFVEDSNYLDEADRAAQDTVMTVTAQDLAGTPQLARQPLEQMSLAFLDGYDYDGTGTGDPFVFLIPGYTDTIGYPIPEFWGRGNLNKSRQIIDSEADGQMKTGRVLAVANNPLRELRLDFRANYLGAVDIVPSVGWYRWGIANATLKRGLSLLNTDWICRRVELRFPAGELWAGAIQVSAIFEGEAFGEDGITANYPTSFPAPTLPTPNWDVPSGAATYGYWAGGNVAGQVVTAYRINFSTEITALNADSNLSLARDAVGSLSDTTTYGYFIGGANGAAESVADRVTFATGATAANAVSNRSVGTSLSPGLSDAITYGYLTGGWTGAALTTVADRITLSTGVTAANAGSDLTGNRQEHAPVSDKSLYGYWAGGRDANGNTDVIATIERTTFATSATAANAQVLSSARSELSGISDNATYGYVSGGWTTGGSLNVVQTCDRVTFATGVFAAYVTGALVTGRIRFGAASDGATYGYWTGGRIAPLNKLATTEQLTFSTGINALKATADITVGTDLGTSEGVSDGAV